MKYRSNLILLLLQIFCIAGYAQLPLLRHYTVADGLPSNVVYNTFQDSEGFIWFCTDQGVSRFDGHRFQNYSIREGLPDNEVFNMAEDSYHRVWLVCYNHQPCYILQGKIYNALNDTLCKDIVKKGIEYTTISKDQKGQSFLAGKRMCTIYKDSISLINPQIDFGGGIFEYFVSRKQEYYLSGQDLFQIQNEKKKVLLTGTFQANFYARNHLYLFSPSDKKFILHDITFSNNTFRDTQITAPPYWMYDFRLSADSSLLCFTAAGIMKWNLKTNKFVDAGILPKGIVANHLVEDDEGNNWFSTLNEDGVYMQPGMLPLTFNTGVGLKSNNVISLSTTMAGTLLAGFNDGSFSIVDSNQIRNVVLPIGGSVNRIKFAFQVSADEFIAGSDRGLFSISPSRHTTSQINQEAQKDGFQKKEYCLVAFSSGAAKYDIQKRKLYQLWDQRTTAIADAKTGVIWMGTLRGLYTCQNGQVIKFNQDSLLSGSRITGLTAGPDSGVVIATHKDGIFVWNQGQLLHITEQQGLSSNSCKKVRTDNQGTVWVCTDRGLDMITFHSSLSFSIYKYSIADGLPTDKVNDVAIISGKINIATPQGIIVLNRNGNRVNIRSPRIYILSVTAHDKAVLNPGSMDLEYDQNDLQVSYTGIAFTGGDLLYRYVLEGGGKDTIYTRNTSINLSAVKPGNYRLLIWARANGGSWSTHPALFAFNISPPFWLRSWFILLLGIAVVSALYVLYRKKIRTVQQAENEKSMRAKQIAELEMQALRAQINPHFLFNALNSIQNFYSQNNERKANHYLSLFSQLIRKTLNYSKTHWLVLSEELNMLRSYIELEQMRFNDAFEYEIHIGERIDPDHLEIPAMLIQPYVENAINHGLLHLENNNGRLILKFELLDEFLICNIDDNGIGIEQAQKFKPRNHKSMGMDITLQRMDTISHLYQTSITATVINKKNCEVPAPGTLIILRLPQKKACMNKLTVLIVDDEKESRTTLRTFLTKYCPEVEIVAEAASVEQAALKIISFQPQLVFLDINMRRENGFVLFDRIPEPVFQTIFVTAHDEYALKAIKQHALDYILKPISIDELVHAVNRAKEVINRHGTTKDIASLLQVIQQSSSNSKLSLPVLDGLVYVCVNDIIRCEAEANYTQFYFTNRNKLLVCKNLGAFETQLKNQGFFRVHHHHLINVAHVEKYQRGRGGIVFMSDKMEIPVSYRKKDEFLKLLERNHPEGL